MGSEADCPFCEIARGDGDGHVVAADERTIAFLDVNPAAPGHIIVAPREHRQELVTAGPETVSAVATQVRAVSTAVEAALDPVGFSVFHTSGHLVGEVTHAHVHVVPRYEDDGVSLALERGRLDDAAAEAMLARIHEEG